jgi:hypothetical protein
MEKSNRCCGELDIVMFVAGLMVQQHLLMQLIRIPCNENIYEITGIFGYEEN